MIRTDIVVSTHRGNVRLDGAFARFSKRLNRIIIPGERVDFMDSHDSLNLGFELVRLEMISEDLHADFARFSRVLHSPRSPFYYNIDGVDQRIQGSGSHTLRMQAHLMGNFDDLKEILYGRLFHLLLGISTREEQTSSPLHKWLYFWNPGWVYFSGKGLNTKFCILGMARGPKAVDSIHLSAKTKRIKGQILCSFPACWSLLGENGFSKQELNLSHDWRRLSRGTHEVDMQDLALKARLLALAEFKLSDYLRRYSYKTERHPAAIRLNMHEL